MYLQNAKVSFVVLLFFDRGNPYDPQDAVHLSCLTLKTNIVFFTIYFIETTEAYSDIHLIKGQLKYKELVGILLQSLRSDIHSYRMATEGFIFSVRRYLRWFNQFVCSILRESKAMVLALC